MNFNPVCSPPLSLLNPDFTPGFASTYLPSYPPSSYLPTISPFYLLSFPPSHFALRNTLRPSHLLTFSSSFFSAFRLPPSKFLSSHLLTFSASFFPAFSPSQLLSSPSFPSRRSSIICLSVVESVQDPLRHTWAVACPSTTCRPSVYPANLASRSAF